jgi:Flp pilus assembly protein TadD
LAGRGQLDEAIAHFQMALKIKPDYAAARNNLGRALSERESLKKIQQETK